MNDNWITPIEIIDRVEKVIGQDYFDPCPVEPSFNGLSKDIDWGNYCFINPPYSRGSLENWSCKAYNEFKKRGAREAGYIWLINCGSTKNRMLIKLQSSAMCDLYQRISFIDPKTGKPKKGNDRDQVIYYWGSRPRLFQNVFQDMGKVFISEV